MWWWHFQSKCTFYHYFLVSHILLQRWEGGCVPEKRTSSFFLLLCFSELCLGSAGFRAMGQRLSGPQVSTPIARLAELDVWWLLPCSGLSAACSVEPLATVQPRQLCKRELALHAVTIGRKCKCGHLCKSNPPSSLLNTLLAASWQSPLPFALFPRASQQKNVCGEEGCVWPSLYGIWRFSMLGPFWTGLHRGLDHETLPCTERCKLEQKWQHTTCWNLSKGSVSPIAIALPAG